MHIHDEHMEVLTRDDAIGMYTRLPDCMMQSEILLVACRYLEARRGVHEHTRNHAVVGVGPHEVFNRWGGLRQFPVRWPRGHRLQMGPHEARCELLQMVATIDGGFHIVGDPTSALKATSPQGNVLTPSALEFMAVLS